VNPARDHVLIGRERQDVGRPHDWGYPVRGIVTDQFLYLRNFEPSRWPVGNPETGYLDCDAGATKTFILAAHRQNPSAPHWALCFGQRPGEELYDLRSDPDCLRNLAEYASVASARAALTNRLFSELTQQGDPRTTGQGEVIDRYPHANAGHVGFYERFQKGEKLKAGWVNETDFEKLMPDQQPTSTPP
jgi:hypothetical protein